MFTCPTCGSGLTRTPDKAGIFWVCQSCGGRAVSVSLLRKTIDQDRVRSIWSQAISTPDQDGRSCPICSRGMSEVCMGVGDQSLKLGVCKRCEFVWFNAMEYESIPPPTPAPKDPTRTDDKDLPQAARETLAIYKVQQMAEKARNEDPEPDENWKTVPALLGLPVEMDSDPLTRIPLATLSLSAVIAIISIWAFFDLHNIVGAFGLIPAKEFRYGGLTFVTSFFLHGGIIHLVSNLYFLIIFGMHVENYLGRKRWLVLVWIAAFAGNLLHVMGDPRDGMPCIGASGGISGLIAFYALKFPHARLGILFRYYYYLKWVQFPAWAAFILWMLLQFWGAYKQIAGFSDVSALAHLGGTAAGILLWVIWRKTELQHIDNAVTHTN